jgi:pyridoxal phosphate enzyme (YggS family)
MTEIARNINFLIAQNPSSVKLIVVSKTRSADEILQAYSTGHRYFGENRVQEIMNKKDVLPADIEWHLIGHLQSNKVKYIVPFISLIQSVDSYKLLKLIDSEAGKISKQVNCLLQIFIAREESKFGFSMDELSGMLDSPEFHKLKHVKICGVMGMATFTSDKNQVRGEFRFLGECFKKLKNSYFAEDNDFKEISMGMSDDYQIAVEEGSTMIRIGSNIFGERN